ncbi:HAD family hydrolase [Rubritalea tangerina]|uniref:phosphoserine phosphatase n=1 Tax=Rubritalea tangerina TaxID=430798 RepID=A0ABW4ZEL7_9BACT
MSVKAEQRSVSEVSVIQIMPSWSSGPSKTAILTFIDEVCKEGGESYVRPEDRIAVFDNDGTLWAEQPIYFQALYAFDRVKEMAPQHPEWKEREPFRSVLAGDLKKALSGGEKSLLEIVKVTHSGMTTEEFAASVRKWIDSAKHPQTGVPIKEMVYQPMLELLDTMRKWGFKTYIVSGGGIDFMRVFSEEVYGIPPEQVIGSSVEVKFELRDGVPVIVREPKVGFIDDKEGKPVGIHTHIGKRPIAAFGNSDGDLQMLQWTAAGDGKRLCVYIHHTDAEREWAYDRDSHIGKLDKGLDEAKAKGWTVVDMKEEWNKIFK